MEALVTKENVLDNPTRLEMFETVRFYPGIHLRELARAMGSGTTLTLYHLRKLESFDLVTAMADECYKYFFVNDGRFSHYEKHVIAATYHPMARRILECIGEYAAAHHKPVSGREVARRLNTNHTTVRWHLPKLESARLIARTEEGLTIIPENYEIYLAVKDRVWPEDDEKTVVEPITQSAVPVSATVS